MRYATAVRHKH